MPDVTNCRASAAIEKESPTPCRHDQEHGDEGLKSDDVQKQSDADLKAVIEKGKGKMPGFAGKLTPPRLAMS